MQKQNHKTFYDIHMHAFNLSHAGLLAFLNRFFLNKTLSLNDLARGDIIKIISGFFSKSGAEQKPFLRRFISAFLSIMVIATFVLLFWFGFILFANYILGVNYSFMINLEELAFRIFKVYGLIWIIVALVILIIILTIIIKAKKVNKTISLRTSRILNTLSIFENDLGRQFRYLELDFLSLNKNLKKIIYEFSASGSDDIGTFFRNIKQKWAEENHISIINNSFDKVILTPLMMDFKYKGFDKLDKSLVHYNLPPRKAIIDQTVDLYNGIRDYMKNSPVKLFEIYPFLGINPENYELGAHNELVSFSNDEITKVYNSIPAKLKEKVCIIKLTKSFVVFQKLTINEINEFHGIIKDINPNVDNDFIKNLNDELSIKKLENRNTIPKMLNKYFSKYTGKLSKFQTNYFKHFGHERFKEDQNNYWKKDFSVIESNFFAGIKVYPPLGFNPWPDETQEKEKFLKANYLYQYCCEMKIPVTTHCSDGGFIVIDRKDDWKFASPKTWMKVLENYTTLKLNLAHFGVQIKQHEGWGEWIDDVLTIIGNDDYPNVYTDFSDIGLSEEHYEDMLLAIEKYLLATNDRGKITAKLKDHILFGTDFMMSLFSMRSYKEYIEIYSESKVFDKYPWLDKEAFCTANPERFLWGEGL